MSGRINDTEIVVTTRVVMDGTSRFDYLVFTAKGGVLPKGLEIEPGRQADALTLGIPEFDDELTVQADTKTKCGSGYVRSACPRV